MMVTEPIAISEIRHWCTAVLDAVEATGVEAVTLDPRHYWEFDSEEVWSSEPPDPVQGDLYDDVADIARDIASPDPVVQGALAWHTLDHLIGVLTKLSADLKGVDLSMQRTEGA